MNASRSTSSVQRSPTTDRARATEQFWLPISLQRMAVTLVTLRSKTKPTTFRNRTMGLDTAADPISGVDLLRAFQAQGPSGGVAQLLGLSIEDVASGRVRLALRTRPELANPHGALHGGIVATLLDSAMACAVL